jgi:hypothetical protein
MVSQSHWRIEIYTLFDGVSGLHTSHLSIPESYESLESASEAADKACQEIRGSGFNIYQSDIEA